MNDKHTNNKIIVKRKTNIVNIRVNQNSQQLPDNIVKIIFYYFPKQTQHIL